MSGLAEAPTAVRSTLSEPTESSVPSTATPENELRYIGLTTRGIAFVVDLALISLVGFLVGEAGSLIASSFHLAYDVKTILKVIGGVAYVLWAASYFIGFWSATGQTPGNRVMQIRVVTASLDPVTPRRGVVRCVGLVLAALPLFLGYAPVLFDSRRRSFADWLARTVVIDAPGVSFAQARSAKRRAANEAARTRQD